ncbi:hypothetical protein [Phaeobacter sp. C3_T13_0]|uniref:hypothetical protein n=1 Tax=Phaeobacter cretensis TaxID=3342641 RepID=UPI0039BD563E
MIRAISGLGIKHLESCLLILEGAAGRDPKVADHAMLPRLARDEEHGLNWDGHHNPLLTFWNVGDDLNAGRWAQAYGLFTDF